MVMHQHSPLVRPHDNQGYHVLIGSYIHYFSFFAATVEGSFRLLELLPSQRLLFWVFNIGGKTPAMRSNVRKNRLGCVWCPRFLLNFFWIPGQAWSSTSSSIPQRRWSPSCFQPRLFFCIFFCLQNWEGCNFPTKNVDELIRSGRSLALRSVCGVCLSLPFVGEWLHWCIGLQSWFWVKDGGHIHFGEWFMLSH